MSIVQSPRSKIRDQKLEIYGFGQRLGQKVGLEVINI